MTAEATGTQAADRLVAVPVRHWGRWVGALVVLAVFALLGKAFVGADIHYHVVGDYFTAKNILTGVWHTLLISVLAQAMGIGLGVLAAVMRQSENPVMSGVGWFYVWLFRGTPLLLQLILWFNLSALFPTISIPGIWSVDTNTAITPFVAALLGLGINEGAYMAEIVRAGIGSVDTGQTEAAHALGMTQGLTLRRVVLPQAMRVIIPPTGNEFVNMLKSSSLASAAQYTELLRVTQTTYTSNFEIMPMLFVAALWYLILTSIFGIGQYFLERRFARGSQRELPATPAQRILSALRPGRR
ncbi:MAG: polar amino acid transport system permease protein [Actinomycetota bacterium]|jgi:polar amino acid transport system permease protein|nr:polar amino acid transport system permease protein [Actinomycetota bacterium]